MSEETENEVKPKKGKKKLILILVPLLLIGGGAGAYFGGVFGGSEEPADAEHAEAEKSDDKHAEDKDHGKKEDKGHAKKDDHGGDHKSGEYVFMELPEIIVNLSSPNQRRSTFLKVKINLELADSDAIESVETVMPRVIDSMQSYMRDLRVEDLQGSEGLYRLREELMHRVNIAIGGEKVNDVLFAEMIMQ